MARHIRQDDKVDSTRHARRRPFALAAGLTGLAVGALIAGGGIAPTDHTGQLLLNAPFADGGQPPPGPPGPGGDDQQASPGPPPPGAPPAGQPGAPGSPAPAAPGAPGAPGQ